MRVFLTKTFLFVCLMGLVLITGVLLPPTPRASKSVFFAKEKKDSLLRKIKPPRLIFIGGSNIGFGLNSKILHDSLRVNPINTSIDAGLGLIYMMDQALPFIIKGDIIVLIPEYHQYYGQFAYGSEDLVRVVLDVNRDELKHLRWSQIRSILKYLPKYGLSKFKPTEYFNSKEHKIYNKNIFNEYGDAISHWNLEKEKFKPFNEITEPFNYSVLHEILSFQRNVNSKGASVFISFPGFQDISFHKSIESIKKVENELRKNNLKILGTPERYMIPDSLMFNTPYHLIKSGVDYRSNLLFQDLKPKIFE